MDLNKSNIIIIGAGLSGLVAAYELKKQGASSITILEAQNRSGGRIHSLNSTNGKGKVEMGATWFGSKHKVLNALLNELGIKKFEQYNTGKGLFEVMSFVPPQIFDISPDNQEPYYRISGGSVALIKALEEIVQSHFELKLDVEVTEIIEHTDYLELKTTQGAVFKASHVISTVPQRLFSQKIRVTPEIPEEVAIRMLDINGWMSNSVKFVAEYEQPFWRKNGMAGMAISQTGIVQEVQDHCNEEETSCALMGFLSGLAHELTKEKREEMVIAHLSKLFGKEANQYIRYIDMDWQTDRFLTPGFNQQLPFKYNFGHPDFRKPLFNDKLFLAGTETSSSFPGYMEGAVVAGKEVVQKLVDLIAVSKEKSYN